MTEPANVAATAVWGTGPARPPTCCRHGCTEVATRLVLILDPDGVPAPMGNDDYCRRHARELAGILQHYGPGRPGYRVEVIR